MLIQSKHTDTIETTVHDRRKFSNPGVVHLMIQRVKKSLPFTTLLATYIQVTSEKLMTFLSCDQEQQSCKHS